MELFECSLESEYRYNIQQVKPVLSSHHKQTDNIILEGKRHPTGFDSMAELGFFWSASQFGWKISPQGPSLDGLICPSYCDYGFHELYFLAQAGTLYYEAL